MDQCVDTNILIHPRRGRKEKALPKVGLLLVNPSEAARCHLQLKKAGGESRSFFNSGLTVDAGQSFFVAGPAIGAPMAAMSMEKLIALGAERIILFGWCGALAKTLRVGDIVLPDAAKSGEGTSCYYQLPQPAIPDIELRLQIENFFLSKSVRVRSGKIWSTDAVYREDRQLLRELHSRDGVAAVDMEFSALCSVACFRTIKFAAVMIVSDELWGQAWKPGFSSSVFIQSKDLALDMVLAGIDTFGEYA